MAGNGQKGWRSGFGWFVSDFESVGKVWMKIYFQNL